MNNSTFIQNHSNIDELHYIHLLIKYLDKDEKCYLRKKDNKYIINKKNTKTIVCKTFFEDLTEKPFEYSKKDLYIYIFLYNTLNDGWTIKKKNNTYIFKKKHENKTEILDSKYLGDFIEQNLGKIES